MMKARKIVLGAVSVLAASAVLVPTLTAHAGTTLHMKAHVINHAAHPMYACAGPDGGDPPGPWVDNINVGQSAWIDFAISDSAKLAIKAENEDGMVWAYRNPPMPDGLVTECVVSYK